MRGAAGARKKKRAAAPGSWKATRPRAPRFAVAAAVSGLSRRPTAVASLLVWTATPIEADKIFFFQAEDGIRGLIVTGVQTCALPICDFFSTEIDVATPAAFPVAETTVSEKI